MTRCTNVILRGMMDIKIMKICEYYFFLKHMLGLRNWQKLNNVKNFDPNVMKLLCNR